MPKVRFTGRVFPSVVQISVHVPELTWPWTDTRLNLIFAVDIKDSLISVDCTLDEYKSEYLTELVQRATDLSKTAANIMAFTEGVGLTVFLDTFIDPEGTPTGLFTRDEQLAQLCTSYSLDPSRQADLDAVIKIIFGEWPLFRALNELIETVSIPHLSLLNCGRVIDGIRRMITPPNQTSDVEAWMAMHNALNIDKSYQQWISLRASGPRHADPTVVIPWEETTQVTRRAWAIMNRFLEYRKRGNIPLTEPDFPRLT